MCDSGETIGSIISNAVKATSLVLASTDFSVWSFPLRIRSPDRVKLLVFFLPFPFTFFFVSSESIGVRAMVTRNEFQFIYWSRVQMWIACKTARVASVCLSSLAPKNAEAFFAQIHRIPFSVCRRNFVATRHVIFSGECDDKKEANKKSKFLYIIRHY